MEKDIVAIDLFCGAGGLTRGLLNTGIKVLKGYDIDSKAKKTYEQNNPSTEFFTADISKLKGEDLISNINRNKSLFLLAGCAPCQPFSQINKSQLQNDKRKNLLLEFGRLIQETKPDLIFMENVPGIKNYQGKNIFTKFVNVLEKEHYHYDFSVLNVKNYGVPQKRRRLVLIASRQSEIKIPEETHGDSADKLPLVTLKAAISRYPPLQAGQNYANIPNHECRKLSNINMTRLRFIKKDGGSRKDLPKKLILKCHSDHNGHGDVYGRMCWDEVSPTLTCKCTSLSNGRFGHPTQNRAISVREAAAIQTFPDEYVFYGSLSDTTRWIGNAVPVKFAEKIGKVFIRTIN